LNDNANGVYCRALRTHCAPVKRRIKTCSIPLGLQLKNALVIVTLSVLLSAGADLQAQPLAQTKSPDARILVAQKDATPPVAANQLTDKKAVDDKSDEQLPSAVLTDDLLYKLLRAELANQRGDWQLAYVTMMVAAQETRDPRLAQRAAEIALNVQKTGEALSAVRLWRELAPASNQANQFYL
jgi:hypothetical protein